MSTKITTLILAALFLISLTGCGGTGDGSSGAGQEYSGTYQGYVKAQLIGEGVNQPYEGDFVLTFDANGNVFYSQSGKELGTGKISGTSFVVPVSATAFNSSSITCSGTVLFKAPITSTTISGNITSQGLSCNGIDYTLTGTFTAKKA